MARNNQSAIHNTLDSLPLPAYVFDRKARRFVAANELFCKLVGYSADELKSLPWPRILAFPDEDLAAVEQLLAAPVAEVAVIFRGRHKDGRVITASVKYREMKFVGDDGEVSDAFFSVVSSVEGEEGAPVSKLFGDD